METDIKRENECSERDEPIQDSFPFYLTVFDKVIAAENKNLAK